MRCRKLRRRGPPGPRDPSNGQLTMTDRVPSRLTPLRPRPRLCHRSLIGGGALGFDFARDPLNAMKPMQTFEETMKADVDARPGVGAAQRKLLEGRYDLQPRLDPAARMSRGKPLVVGPTA